MPTRGACLGAPPSFGAIGLLSAARGGAHEFYGIPRPEITASTSLLDPGRARERALLLGRAHVGVELPIVPGEHVLLAGVLAAVRVALRALDLARRRHQVGDRPALLLEIAAGAQDPAHLPRVKRR